MSSFVLLTQYGPPDLIVEVGQPISSDPVLLSGLFKAIMSFTDEVAQAPLQVLQTKGFTVQFKTMFEDYVLIVGTNHTIIGLEMILDQISDIVADGFRHNVDPDVIENAIRDVLHNYVEFNTQGKEMEGVETLPEQLLSMFTDIPEHIYEILFYGLLSGYKLRYPKTDSMDLNRNLTKFMEFIDQSCCSDLDPNCFDTLAFVSRKDKFLLREQEFKRKDIIKPTKLLKDLMEYIKAENFMELKIKQISELGTLTQFEQFFLNFNPDDHTDAEQHDIDDLRYVLGLELEHYLLLRLYRKNKALVKYLQENTQQTEWMSSW